MKQNTVHNVRVGDVIEYKSSSQTAYVCARPTRVGCFSYTVTAVYPHFIEAECGLKRISINYGELVTLGYEKQSLRNQALIEARNRAGAWQSYS
ncbi:MAG: hypothetical protein LIP10_13195 [Clostridiales bacterium]|nr:hypothetical protein [Clostridiales bacterium]